MARREVREFGAAERRVELSNGTVVYVPSVAGAVKQWLPQTERGRITRMPAERDEAEDFFDAALAEHEVVEQEVLQLDLQAVPDDDVVAIEPAGEAGANERRVLLYRDESGGFSWHLPDATRKPRERFIVPLRTAAARESLAQRNLTGPATLTRLGRKTFKVLVLPLATAGARAWEARKGQEVLRTLTPDDFRDANVQAFTDWRSLTSGRGLLVLHDVFSSTTGMLAGLTKPQMEALHARYEGRVVAFDHFSVSKSVEENAADLVKRLREGAGGRRLEFDVLAHGRGGIVARALREGTAARDVADFRKIFFVAPPNHGTALANDNRIVDLVDVFTNLITDFPGGAIASSIDVVLATLKCAAMGTTEELPGIRDLRPGFSGYIESKLNGHYVNGLGNYACVAASYKPDPQRDDGFFNGRQAFPGVENDLVVPTRGAFEELGAQGENITSVTFTSGVWHSGFFANAKTMDLALEHFEREDVEEEATESYGGLRGFDDDFFDAVRSIGTSNARASSAEMPAPAAAPSPTLLRRNPALEFFPTIVAGEGKPLRLSLEEVAAGAIAGVNLLLGAGVDAVDVSARVLAPGFDVSPEVQTMTLRVERVKADETKIFELTAHAVQQPTPRTITAEFSIGTVPVGGISYVTTVVPAGAQAPAPPEPPTPAHFTMATAQRDRCDMKIVVSATGANLDEAQPPFPVSVTSAVPGKSYDDDPMGAFTPKGGDVAQYLQTTLGTMLNARPDPPQDEDGVAQYLADLAVWNRNMIESLREFGTELWSWLPDRFKARYFEHVDAGLEPRSILINSVDMYFPWELVVPWRDRADGTRDELAPLGQAHVIGRWRPGLAARPEPQRFRLQRIALVHPEYADGLRLDGAIEESTALLAFFGAPTAYPVDAASGDRVQTELLDVNDVQLMHFCGHAVFDAANPDQSYLVLGDESPLTALKLAASKLTSGKPFIVLNACSVGQPGTIASRAGGFAAKCLNRGCSAVLAAYWPISDRSAKEFSLALYGKLKAGRAIGEALQELRAEHAGNPTFQAYTFFGDPLARLLF